MKVLDHVMPMQEKTEADPELWTVVSNAHQVSPPCALQLASFIMEHVRNSDKKARSNKVTIDTH